MKRFPSGLVLGVCGIAGATGYLVGRPAAPGLPSPTPFTYSGIVTDDAGKALSGKIVSVALFDAASAGNQLCAGEGPSVATGGDGRFGIPLEASCSDVIRTSSNLFVEISVDGTAMPTRTQIGAVPYAAVSESSTRTDSVPFAGVTNITSTTQWPGTASVATPGSQLDHLANPNICGLTAKTTGHVANTDGYHAAALACRSVTGCSATNATVCTNTDVVRFVANHGGSMLPTDPTTNAWIATGYFTIVGANAWSDCVQFTFGASGTNVGMRVSLSNDPNPGLIDDADCSTQFPILCCDY